MPGTKTIVGGGYTIAGDDYRIAEGGYTIGTAVCTIPYDQYLLSSFLVNPFAKNKEEDKSYLYGRLWQVMAGGKASAIIIPQRLSEN